MSQNQDGEAATEYAATTPDPGSGEAAVLTPEEKEVHTPSGGTEDNRNKPVSDRVDYDAFLQKPQTREERGGMSRAEFQRKKEELEQEQDDASTQRELENALAKIEALERKFEAQETDISRQKVQSLIDTKIKDAGINPSSFNAQYKDDLFAKQAELMKKGLNAVDALGIAADIIIPKVQSKAMVEEAERRAAGRKGASLPPTGIRPGQTTYSLAQLSGLSQADYNKVMKLKEEGKVTVV